VVAHLPEEIRPVIQFAASTGWRIASEVLPLEWRQVGMEAGEVRLDPHSTKNGEGRVFPFTAELRALLKDRQQEHERLKKAGHIFLNVFFRDVADGRGERRSPAGSSASPRRGSRRAARRAVLAGFPTIFAVRRSEPWCAPPCRNGSRCS
jgi:integrase